MNKNKRFVAHYILSAVLCAPSIIVMAQTDEVGPHVESLWQQNKIPELGTYLQPLATSSPNDAPAVAAGALYDFLFVGKLNAAAAKLSRISAAAQASPENYPSEFVALLQTTISVITDEIRIQTNRGKPEADWQANVNPQAVRNAAGNDYLFIKLIKATPKVALPSS